MLDILDYEDMVYKVISKYRNYYDLDDLYQVGMIGLKKALDHYKDNKETKFSSFAWFYIKGEVYKYIREDNTIKISPDIIRLNNSINKTKELMQNKMGREVSLDEVSIYLDVDYEKIVEAVNSTKLVESLDKEFDDDNLYNHIAYNDKETNADIMDLKEELNKLSREDKELIVSRYFDNMTQKETSKKLGITQVQVSRKEAKVLTKLKNNL